MASGDEKFNVEGVKGKMATIEGYFSEFATTLDDINAYIQTNVNASVESAAFGDLGGKLLSIWDYNAATFNDFHENFDNWAQVVAIIAANNNTFAVDALATYRDNAGTLDGVKEAREYVAANNGVSNSGSNYGTLSNDAKSIIDSSIAQGAKIADPVNIFGGKTIKTDDGKIEYYDADDNLVSYYKDGKYYDKDGNEIGGFPEYKKWLEENGYQKSKTEEEQAGDEEAGDDDKSGDGKHDADDPDNDDDKSVTGEDERGKYTSTTDHDVETRVYEDGSKLIIQLDDHGKPRSQVYQDADGNTIYEEEFNEDGSIKKHTDYDIREDGTWYKVTENGETKYYNPNGNEVSQSEYEGSGNDSEPVSGVEDGATKETFENPSGGRRDKYTNPDGSQVEVDYDASGTIKFRRNTDSNGVVTETVRYDEKGNPIEKYEFTVEDLGDGVYKSTPKHYILDEKGNLVEDSNYNSVPMYEWNDESGSHHISSDPNEAPIAAPTEEPVEEAASSDDAEAVNEITASMDHRDDWERLDTIQNDWDHSRSYKYGDVIIVAYGDDDDVVAFMRIGEDGQNHIYDSDYNEISYDQYDALLRSVNGVE